MNSRSLSKKNRSQKKRLSVKKLFGGSKKNSKKTSKKNRSSQKGGSKKNRLSKKEQKKDNFRKSLRKFLGIQ